MNAVDVVVSFAEADDVPSEHEKEGWVTRFTNELQYRLSRYPGSHDPLGVSMSPIDSTPRQGSISNLFSATDVLVIVLSPQFLEENAHGKELNSLLSTLDFRTAVERLVFVIKDSVPSETLPHFLAANRGPIFDLSDEKDFQAEMDDLAWEIHNKLTAISERSSNKAENLSGSIAREASSGRFTAEEPSINQKVLDEVSELTSTDETAEDVLQDNQSTISEPVTEESTPTEAVHASDDRPIWLCQYGEAESGFLDGKLVPGLVERWSILPYTTEEVRSQMKVGDSVVLWRASDESKPFLSERNPGGIVGWGKIVELPILGNAHDIRLEVTQVFRDGPVARENILDELGWPDGDWPGQLSLKRLSRDEAEAFRRYQPQAEPQATEYQERHQTELSSDRAETTRDLLRRAPLAFTLAHHVNRIWSEQNKPAAAGGGRTPEEAAFILHIDSPWGGGKTTFANYLSRILNPEAFGLDPEVEGKKEGSLFADLRLDDESYWPKDFRGRKWITVPFNAWQNQHVRPPWWNFYGAIRSRCLQSLPIHARAIDWVKEWAWRIWSPDFQRTLFVVAVVLAIAWPLMDLGILKPTGKATAPQKTATEQPATAKGQSDAAANKPPQPSTQAPPKQTAKTPSQSSAPAQAKQVTNNQSQQAAGAGQNAQGNTTTDKTNPQQGTPAGNTMLNTILVLVLTGGSGFALLKSFKSGLSKIVDSAGTSVDPGALGEADPIRRFRKRFARAMRDYKEPVLVVVDDLDRCEPDYVVELVRGMLTIFRSPRVVFVLLGDKSWIETSFANVHEDMSAAHTDDEISFGERFAEKAIQPSFVLPEPDEDSREAYIEYLLLGKDAGKAGALDASLGDDADGSSGSSSLSDADRAEMLKQVEDFKEQTRVEFRVAKSGADRKKVMDQARDKAQVAFAASEEMHRAVESMINREAALRTASSEHTDLEIRHGVSELKGELPDNPRRIKRIINMIAAYQASGQSVLGVDPGTDRWRQLVLWIIMMSEHPEAWRVLSAHPEFADLVIDNGTVEPEEESVTETDETTRTDLFATVSREGVVRLIKGDSFEKADVRIDTEAVGWLRRLTPIA